VEYWTQALALNETAAGRIRRANLYVLALADAQAALELDPSSAGAHFQAAHALDVLGHMKEDHRFHEHTGIDWLAKAAACIRDLEAGRVVSEGSTITQQLVKTGCGRRHRTWLAKLYEAVLAWKLEQKGSERF
jgi:DNA-binding PucR family transcriptional regulator